MGGVAGDRMMRFPHGTRRRGAYAAFARAITGSLCLLAALVASASRAHAQGFDALFTRDGIDVWAVGEGGLYWRSFYRGARWTNPPPPGNPKAGGGAARALLSHSAGAPG